MPRSTSVWLETAYPGKYAALKKNARADVCVIGAGIAGLSTAYLLAREGHSVIVIDDGRPGCGEILHPPRWVEDIEWLMSCA